MLKKIKTSYFIKIIFSFIREQKKIKMLKYNKILQNIIVINLINYKFFSGKYIISYPNGTIKEYNGFNDRIVFLGKYLSGKRNGKGKEFDSDNNNLIFSGEYLDGKRSGKGK